MSGTSLDGLDIALCDIEGHGTDTRLRVAEFITVEFSELYRDRVRSVFSKRQVDLQQVTVLNAWIGREHAHMVNQTLKDWGIDASDIDCIASHGQTIFHAPQHQHGLEDLPHATLQIGDGDHIAHLTGILTLSDFRQKHLAAGGEGAPLVKYGDFLLFSNAQKTRILLNIGGIANLTYLPAKGGFGDVVCGDVGPGNTLMDQYVQRCYPGNQFDRDAGFARRGQVNDRLLAALYQHPYFAKSLPKTTGPELFNLDFVLDAQRRSQTESVSADDVIATLNQLTARAIVNAIEPLAVQDAELYISGGGLHNPLLMQTIRDALPQLTLDSTQAIGMPADAKEAALFALLANECIAGTKHTFGSSQVAQDQAPLALSLGKICLP
ncbi:anhydro-N-acetylmuramic acid kinase [Alteromonas sp. SM 2104]|nr:anhydro-N-acetylmuramic acid kinase [Alteromonas oceanisediminis]